MVPRIRHGTVTECGVVGLDDRRQQRVRVRAVDEVEHHLERPADLLGDRAGIEMLDRFRGLGRGSPRCRA